MRSIVAIYMLITGLLFFFISSSSSISSNSSEYQDVLLDVRKLLSSSLGAISTLVYSKNDFKSLKSRNLSILKYLSNHTEFRFDVIIFHEGIMPSADAADLQAATPALPLVFVRVDELFYRPGKWNTFGYCKENAFTKQAGEGYKRMCRFWFMDFYKLLRGYSWMMR